MESKYYTWKKRGKNMITINKSLDYGVEDNIDKRLLVIRELRIRGNENDIKMFLGNLDKLNINIANYNCDPLKYKNYTYYSWKYEEDYSYITLTYNSRNSVVKCIQQMNWLIDWLKGYNDSFFNYKLEIEVKYESIDNLLKKIKDNIEFENKTKEIKRNIEEDFIKGEEK